MITAGVGRSRGAERHPLRSGPNDARCCGSVPFHPVPFGPAAPRSPFPQES